MQYVNNFVLFSLGHTHLQYALPLWGVTYKSYLIKLERLENKPLRIISKTKIRGRITPQYYKYEILKLEDLYNGQRRSQGGARPPPPPNQNTTNDKKL